MSLLERVLELNPGANWAFDRLKLAFNSAGRWAELFQLYDRALELIPSEARIELLREAAMAAKDFAAEPDRAIGYFEQLDVLAPGDSRIDASLERLYERQGRKKPLITLLMRRLDSTKGRKKLELRSRISSLWLELGEVVSAFELVEAMLQDDPESLEAVGLLERLIEMPAARDSVAPPPPEGAAPASTRSPVESVMSVRDKSASYLKARYEAAGRTVDVVRMLQIEAESAATLDDRVARLRQIVSIRLEQLGDEPGALTVLCQLVRIEPGAREHRGRLAEVAARIGADAQRAALLSEVGFATGDIGLRGELLREAADVEERKVGNIDQAITLWLEVLEAGDEAAGAALEAARRLDGLLARASRLAERRGVLERLAELEADAGARQRALGEAARVAMTLGDPERAIRAWRARLDDDPRDAEALDGLCAALEQAARWDELASALEQRATLAGDPAAARRDRVALARLHAEKRGKLDAAIDAWRRVREAYGPDDESSEALGALLEAERRFEELAQHLAGEAERAQDPTRRAALYQKLGQVLAEGIKDPLRALNAFVWAGDWESAISVAAGAGPEQGLSVCQSLLDVAVDAWTAAAEPQPGAERAAGWAIDELVTRLREQGRHAELVALLLRGASLPLPRKRRRELRREAACLTSDRLDDAGRAIEIFKQLFQEDAGDEAALSSVTRLALLLEEQELLTDLVALWEEQARARALAGDTAASAALWARAAEIAETRVADVDRAIADHRQGAGLGGEGSLEALARLYESRGEHARAAEVLEWLTAGSTRDVLAERALRLAEAYIAAGDRRRARQRLEEAAAQALDASGVRRRLGELYREAQDWAALAELCGVEASRAPDVKSRLGLLREAALLHLERRDDPASAVPLLEQAIELDADEPALRLLLSDALRRAGRLDDAAAALRAQIERYGARRPKERATVHFALARVALEAGMRAEALGELDLANKIDPAHPGILRQIARLAFQEQQLDRAEKMYRALLLVLGREQATAEASRAEALLDLSEIAALRDDDLRATEFVESAFEAAFDSQVEAEALERALRERGRTKPPGARCRGPAESGFGCVERCSGARRPGVLA